MSERTLAIIKPDAVKNRVEGQIIERILASGFRIAALRMVQLTREKAEGFYAVHRQRPFFKDLTAFMSEGPVIVMVLEAENAIQRWRDLMGATNPAQAAEGTIRRAFGAGIERNATHGSDAPDTAAFEIAYFFSEMEML